MRSSDGVIEWLLAGDPVIRWQTMRDLLDEPAETWEAAGLGWSIAVHLDRSAD